PARHSRHVHHRVRGSRGPGRGFHAETPAGIGKAVSFAPSDRRNRRAVVAIDGASSCASKRRASSAAGKHQIVPWTRFDMIFRTFAFTGALLIAAAAMAQTSQVEVKDAWARATPGKAETGAAYLTIQSTVPDRLVGVSTPVAKKAGLHTMTMEGSVMKM